MQDYEYAGLQRKLAWRAARRVIVPDAIPIERLEAAGARAGEAGPLPGPEGGLLPRRLRARPGGARRARPRRARRRCPPASDDERVLVVVRPPPETSAYHADNPLYERVLDRLCADPRVVTVLIPRTDGPGQRPRWPAASRSLVVPDRAIDAQSLIAYSDLVVSAGGTMNREAVALGVPVLDDLQRPDGRRRRAPDRRRPARRAAATRPTSSCASASGEPGPGRSAAIPAILVDGALGAVG